MTELGQDEIKALEQTRQRLMALHSSLTALQQNLFEVQPLPSWSSLQTHSSQISNNLQTVAQQLSNHQDLLASLVVYPVPQFPGRTQEHILQQMLRTKLEPSVEDWVTQGQEIAQSGSQPFSPGLSENDRNELWQWAPIAANDEVRKQKWGADYTLAEKEMGIDNVVTGLRRELDEPADDDSEGGEDEEEEEDEEADDDAEDDSMDVVEVRRKPGGSGAEIGLSTKPTVQHMPLETILRFMMTGAAVPGRPGK